MARIKSSDTTKRASIVYMAVNQVNGKRYIGITSRYLCWRKYGHFASAEKNNSPTYFHRAIRKYGRKNFVFEVLINCETFEEANKLEIKFIAEMKPEYNLAKGGGGYLGYKPSEEERQRASVRMKGRPSFWIGKKLPASFLAGGDRWRNSDEGVKSWAQCRTLGPKILRRQIVCLDDGRIFESILAASAAYGINSASISTVCKRSTKRRTAGGMVFRYFGDHEGGFEDAQASKAAANKKGRKLERPHYQKAVRCVDDGRVFDSAVMAASFYKVDHGTISAVCRKDKHYHTAAGRKFEFASRDA